jgi:hypothetical protein
MEVQLRIYDDTSDVPQPQGPVILNVPDGASDEQIVEQIRREWVDPARPAFVRYRGGDINPGWGIYYAPAEATR